MFKTISRLLFGGEEEKPTEVKSGEGLEEGWHVVSHQEAGSAENQSAEHKDSQPSDSAVHGDTVSTMEADIGVLDPEPADQSTRETVTGSAPHIKALLEATPLNCVHKSKADRHQMNRNAIQRQNRLRQGVQHHSFHLQQPAHRHLSH